MGRRNCNLGGEISFFSVELKNQIGRIRNNIAICIALATIKESEESIES